MGIENKNVDNQTKKINPQANPLNQKPMDSQKKEMKKDDVKKDEVNDDELLENEKTAKKASWADSKKAQ